MATRTQKIAFINERLRNKDGKRIPKTKLKDMSDKFLDETCERFADAFQDYLANPPIKLTRFFAEVSSADGKDYTLEGKAENIEAYKEMLINDNYTVTKIVPAKGHHVCKYCGSVTDGSQSDILCEDCREIFGHSFYSEL